MHQDSNNLVPTEEEELTNLINELKIREKFYRETRQNLESRLIRITFERKKKTSTGVK